MQVEELGKGRVDGSTTALPTRQRERLRARVLSNAIIEHPDRTARPTWVFPQVDKTNGAWLIATPTPDTYIPYTFFREAMAAHLCLPSPRYIHTPEPSALHTAGRNWLALPLLPAHVWEAHRLTRRQGQ